MQECERSSQRVRLQGTFRRNPGLIISQYRALAGFDLDEPLPQRLTVIDMIESILDNEVASPTSSGILRFPAR
jgi:hypothetical protein